MDIMIPRRFKYEGWLYMLAFLLALGLRLVQLGALPLTDAEAEPALQALRLSQGLKPPLSPHPIYILFTTPIFFLYGGATNFLARLIPALVGSTLVFVPALFEGRLKPRPSVILAFFLAIEPGLVALSRTAASGIFAITFLLFAWGFWINNRNRLTGSFAALALLSGPFIWAGLLTLGITWAIRQGMEARPAKEEPKEDEQPPLQSPVSNLKSSIPDLKSQISLALLSFIATFLLVGTLLFLAPSGLGAALASLPEYLRGWSLTSNVPSSRLFLSLVVYQPLAVMLALISIGRGWWQKSRGVILLSLWFLVALLLAAFYPSHQVSDVAWMLIPLWSLAALELARHLNIHQDERREVIGVGLLTIFILIFTWLDLAALIWLPTPSRESTLRIGLLIGSLLLLGISLVLVGFGWSIRSARFGAIWGLTIALGIFGFTGMLGAAGLRGVAYPELWSLPLRPAQAELLDATIGDLSEWAVGDKHALPVLIVGMDSTALEWALRNHPVSFAKALDPSASPDFVITTLEIDPALAASYRGQDFTWRQTPVWDTSDLQAWIRWIVLREIPQNYETIILWARDDLFLDAASFP
jgi:hypothetical protein